MTQNDLNDSQAPTSLSAADDDFDGLELAGAVPKTSKPKSRLVLIVVLLALIGGSIYGAYIVFLGGSLTPPMPVPVAATPMANEQIPMVQEQAAPEASVPAVVETDPLTNDIQAAALPEPAAAEITSPETASVTETAMADTANTTPAEAVVEPAPESVEPVAAVAEPELPQAQETQKQAPEKPVETPAVETTVSPVPEAPSSSVAELKPIDPLPIEPVPAQATKTLETAQAVQEILGTEAVQAGQINVTQEQKMLAPAEVTPRAKQVIVVNKEYSRETPQARNAAGERVMQAGYYNDAAVIFNQQLQANPSDPIALAGKALSLQKAGRLEEALSVYDRLLDLNPRDVEALTNQLGLLQKQQPQIALTRLKSLAAQYPDNASVIGQLGMVQARMMDTPNALRSFQKAAALDATDPTYPFNSAVLYDRLGNTEKAREYYLDALSIANRFDYQRTKISIDQVRARLAALGNGNRN